MKKLFILLLILLSGYTFTACCSCEDNTSDDDDYSAESDNDDNCWITSTEEEDYDDEDDDCDSGYAPDDCDTSPPDYGTVRIDITVNSLNSEIPVTIYAGDFELNKIVLTDKLTSDASYTLPNGYYSVKAEYKVELE